MCLRIKEQNYIDMRAKTVQVKEIMIITYLLLFLKEYFTEKCEFCYYLVTLVSFKGTVHTKILSFPTCFQTLNTKEDAVITKYFRLPLTSIISLATRWKSMGTKTLLSSYRFGLETSEVTKSRQISSLDRLFF